MVRGHGRQWPGTTMIVGNFPQQWLVCVRGTRSQLRSSRMENSPKYSHRCWSPNFKILRTVATFGRLRGSRMEHPCNSAHSSRAQRVHILWSAPSQSVLRELLQLFWRALGCFALECSRSGPGGLCLTGMSSWGLRSS